jgi:tRNA threonylcarbamoyladenosine biosynthesis protein TsaB
MKILALDTATNSCSVAVADSVAGMLSESTVVTRQTHSKHLMEMIDGVIRMSGLQLPEIDGFAVTKGPGSFTGLRIGISVIKGLAFAMNRPVVGVSSLDALAVQFPFSSHLICTLLDARKKEVYCARYRFERAVLKKETEEYTASPAGAVEDIREPCLFVGNGARLYQQLISDAVGEFAQFASPFFHTIRASSVAGLSIKRFEENDTDDATGLVPHYIRKSDAEIVKRET